MASSGSVYVMASQPIGVTMITTDAAKTPRDMRMHFSRVRNAEKGYMRQLVGVARQIGLIVKGFAPLGRVKDLPAMMNSLDRYADLLEPWAQQVVGRMVEDVNRRDANAWNAAAADIGQTLRHEIESAPVGHVMRETIAEQVAEVRSLPIEAAKRVYWLAERAVASGGRSEDIARQILETEDVTIGRAKMIARSAVSTTATNLVEARAVSVGSPGYFWRTSRGTDVRDDHRELEGTYHTWDNPPIVDRRSGYRSHPGCNANCMCWPQVILPEPEI